MNSPIPAGHGRLNVEFVHGESAAVSVMAANPLKLLTPGARGRSAWVYTSSFGGGLVAGDTTRLDVRIGPGARCYLGTQASAKVYRNPGRLPCGHVTRAVVEQGSLLVYTPDPVQAFAGSTYTQHQIFDLAPDAGLVLLDWFTAGRAACGERWAFHRFKSRNEVWCAANGSRHLTFLDSLLLDSAERDLTTPHAAGRFNCLALLLLLGPPVRETASMLLDQIAAQPVEKRAALACSASPLLDGAVLRIAGERSDHVAHELHRHLQHLHNLLGDDPWARKW